MEYSYELQTADISQHNLNRTHFPNQSDFMNLQKNRFRPHSVKKRDQASNAAKHNITDISLKQHSPEHLQEIREARHLNSTIANNYSKPMYNSINFGSTKLKPHQFPFDKEQMHEEMMRIKEKDHKIAAENMKLKTKIQMYEKEITQKNKEIEELSMQERQLPQRKYKAKIDSHLIINLKSQNKVLTDDLKNKEELIESLKRNMKVTKYQELEVELNLCTEECQRLRNELDSIIQKKTLTVDIDELQQKYIHQTNLLKEAKQKNNELAREYKIIEEELKKLKPANSNKKPKNDELVGAKRMAENYKKEATKLRHDMSLLKAANTEDAVNKMDQLISLNNSLVAKLEQKDNIIKELKVHSSKNITNNGSKYSSPEKAQVDKSIFVHYVSIEEATPLLHELTLKMQIASIQRETLIKLICGNKEHEEKITIYEIKHNLVRSPISLRRDISKNIARHLIENDINGEYEYSRFLYKKIKVVAEKLKICLKEYSIFDTSKTNELTQSVCSKLAPHIDTLAKSFAIVDYRYSQAGLYNIINTLNSKLTNDETQFISYIIYKEANSYEKMQYHPLLQILKSYAKSHEVSHPNDYNEEAFEIEESKAVSNDAKVSKPINSAPPFVSHKYSEGANTEEKVMIDTAQKAFIEISNKLSAINSTAKQFFSKLTVSKEINYEVMRVISNDNFIAALKELKLSFDPKTIECLIKVLRASENDIKFLRVDDLEQILNEYETETKSNLKIAIKFDEVDEITMVILYELSHYLSKADMAIRQLLAECIYMHPVKSNDKTEEFEVIKYAHLVEVITSKIGIEVDGHDLTNLKQVFSLSKEETDLLLIPKLDYAISELRSNSELSKLAKSIYNELVTKQDELAHEEDITENNDKLISDKREEIEKQKIIQGKEGAANDNVYVEIR